MESVVWELWVKEELSEVVEVRSAGDGVEVVVLAFEEDVLRLFCEHALQTLRSLEEKQDIY